MKEVVCVERCRNWLKWPRGLVEFEEERQVSSRAGIGKVEGAFDDAEILFDEAQDSAEVQPVVVHVSRWGVSRDDDKRNPKAILVVALDSRQDSRRFVIVPAAPIVPCNDDCSVVPVNLTVAALRIVSHGVDNRCHPGRTAASVGSRVIGILAVWHHPTNLGQVAGGDVVKYLRRSDKNLIGPGGAGTLAGRRGIRHTDMLNRIGRRPD